MDITCPRCGEKMDLDELFDSVMKDYCLAVKAFYDPQRGCGMVLDGKPCKLAVNKQTYRAKVFRDVLGDDLDAIAAMEEDMAEIDEDL